MPSSKSVRITKSTNSKSRIRRMRSRKKRKSDTLQQTIGNQAVGRMIQAKLSIGKPDDKYEREADHVADKVMRMPEPASTEDEETAVQAKPLLQRQAEPSLDKEEIQVKQLLGYSPAHSVGPIIQRVCAECKEEMSGQSEEELVQTKQLADQQFVARQASIKPKAVRGHTPRTSPMVAANIHSLNNKGKPLPRSIRAFFESRMGTDFSQVRVHADTDAAETAKSINARAFTVGRNIAFGSGQYAPESQAGKRLLGHELTHVVQQGGALLSQSTSSHGNNLLLKKSIESAPTDTHVVGSPMVGSDQGERDLQSAKFSGNTILELTLDNQFTLKKGDSHGSVGRAVQLVQEALESLGFILPRFGADGNFGSETKATVKIYQKINALQVDGKIGPETNTAYLRRYCFNFNKMWRRLGCIF